MAIKRCSKVNCQDVRRKIKWTQLCDAIVQNIYFEAILERLWDGTIGGLVTALLLLFDETINTALFSPPTFCFSGSLVSVK